MPFRIDIFSLLTPKANTAPRTPCLQSTKLCNDLAVTVFESDSAGWGADYRDWFDLYLMVVVALPYFEMADAAVL